MLIFYLQNYVFKAPTATLHKQREKEKLCNMKKWFVCRVTAMLQPLAADRMTSAYTLMCAVEAVASVTCEPGSRTTDAIVLHSILSDVAALGRPIFQLFFHPAGKLTCLNVNLQAVKHTKFLFFSHLGTHHNCSLMLAIDLSLSTHSDNVYQNPIGILLMRKPLYILSKLWTHWFICHLEASTVI